MVVISEAYSDSGSGPVEPHDANYTLAGVSLVAEAIIIFLVQ